MNRFEADLIGKCARNVQWFPLAAAEDGTAGKVEYLPAVVISVRPRSAYGWLEGALFGVSVDAMAEGGFGAVLSDHHSKGIEIIKANTKAPIGPSNSVRLRPVDRASVTSIGCWSRTSMLRNGRVVLGSERVVMMRPLALVPRRHAAWPLARDYDAITVGRQKWFRRQYPTVRSTR